MENLLQELLVSFITSLGALAVALIAVHYDRKLEVKRELDSVLTGLVFELGQNLSIAKTIRHSSEDALESIGKGGWQPSPHSLFMDLACLEQEALSLSLSLRIHLITACL